MSNDINWISRVWKHRLDAKSRKTVDAMQTKTMMSVAALLLFSRGVPTMRLGIIAEITDRTVTL